MRITAFLATLLLALIMLSAPPQSSAQIAITVGFGPPALPVYDLPVCPGDGYLWTPGYWAWDGDFDDYYWVPGTWVESPEVGFLWTPPWWGWNGSAFLFHEGWWGPTIGFYGGINYGFGYFGVGFVGGRWDGGHFFYNRDVFVNSVVNIHNVYNEHVNITVNHISYNGGAGGIVARATAEEERAASERHIAAVAAQTQHIEAARANRDMRASVNQGRPAIAATSRPGEFSGHGAVAAREAGAPYHPPAGHAAGGGEAHPENGGGRSFTHPNDLPALDHPTAPNTGNAKQDQKYQNQQQKLYNKQNQERQQLQARQDQEHQKAEQNHANDSSRQQMEQRHQQQTQQLQDRHTQQRQQLQQRQSSPPGKR
jgi:hypothetical protein